LLLAETKESEIMDTSSEQQRTYEESERERERVGREMEKEERWKPEKSELGKIETGNWKVRSLKKGRRKRTRKKRKGGGKEKRHK
jgi:hypothetical protein